jgi:hypothetical protein
MMVCFCYFGHFLCEALNEEDRAGLVNALKVSELLYRCLCLFAENPTGNEEGASICTDFYFLLFFFN